MKSVTAWNTTVGAISGATPILIGWTATGAPLNWQLVAMFAVLFVWQFPHFLSIAWIYRKDYGKAGLQMITVTDPSGATAGRYAWWSALAVIAISWLPMLAGFSLVYVVLVTALGLYQALVAWQFSQVLTDLAARKLLTASIIYLPLALGLMAAHTIF
jgi:protoheme IX farnesyltransferase